MFPASIDGEIDIPALESNRESVLGVLTNIERALLAEKAKNLRLAGNRLSFEAGIFRMVGNWNILVPVGYGEIEVVPGKPGKVKYAFSCRQMLVCTIVMACVMGAVTGYDARGFRLSSATAFAAFAWSWLFGMNYLFASFRLPGFVRNAVEH